MADEHPQESTAEAINVAFRWKLIDQLQFTFSLPGKFLRTALYSLLPLGAILAAYQWLADDGVSSDVQAIVGLFALFFLPALIITVLFSNVLLYFRLSDDQKQVVYDINQERLLVTDATGSQSITPWSIVTRFHERRPGYVLEIRPGQARWIPKRILSDAERAILLSIAKRL